MARADLQNALVIDHEIYEASRVDPSLLDPIVRIEGTLPGRAKPFTVFRSYNGPHGAYSEYFTITDKSGREVARSRIRRTTLRGQMFSDQLASLLRDVRLHDGAEHIAHFYINDIEVGSIPVFVEAADGGDARVAAEETFNKALQKGTILWVSVPRPPDRKGRPVGDHTQAAWFVFDDGKVYISTGPTEQEIPGLVDANEVTLIARSKDLRSAVSTVPATTRIVSTDEDLWASVARAGLGRRLNLPDGDGAYDRWRERCTLVELTPQFHLDDADSGPPVSAAAPAAQAGESNGEAEAKPAKKADDIHVEAQVDQEVFDQLIAEGKSERIARSKAKAAYVRREKARLRAEQENAS